MNAKFLLSALALSTISMPAFAQMAGPRAEIRIGHVGADFETSATDHTTNDRFERSREDGAFTVGGEIGYDHNIGRATLGVYAGLDSGGAKACDELYGLDAYCAKTGRDITAGARLGILLGDNALVYAKGGYSNGRLKFAYVDAEEILPDFEGSANRGGYHFGGGAEINVKNNVYAKFEYTHTEYSDARVGDFRFDHSRDRFSTGVGIRF